MAGVFFTRTPPPLAYLRIDTAWTPNPASVFRRPLFTLPGVTLWIVALGSQRGPIDIAQRGNENIGLGAYAGLTSHSAGDHRPASLPGVIMTKLYVTLTMLAYN